MDIISGMVGSFLVALPALFSIVNPIGGALIYSQVTIGRPHAERITLAYRVAVYSAIVMLVSLWIGASLMSFFGVSIEALRVAGGLVVAASAWGMLYDPKENEDRKHDHAASAAGESDVAFFPLTMPFTTGPGTISVAIALSASRPSTTESLLPFYAGASGAARRRDLLRLRGSPRIAARSRACARPHAPVGFPSALHRRSDPDLRRTRSNRHHARPVTIKPRLPRLSEIT
ncbi:multiple antibiotic resistance (MarC)-like protein [Hyphomicrobium denitrificans 1NES1]|uniref:UPF0056 membrane protein n=1 Tax=Hyphomicrobium denitrificans 1NES1 TaxID=670307 RepID=N0AYN5_9HYPH|nr:multiple antibiotic resistance (MarC)-like protein [Hyphomicrobium denitrificans 1NES1]